MLVEILAMSLLPVVAEAKVSPRAPGHAHVAPPGQRPEIRCRDISIPSRSAGRLLIGPSVDRFSAPARTWFGAKAIAVALGRWIDGTIGALAVKRRPVAASLRSCRRSLAARHARLRDRVRLRGSYRSIGSDRQSG